MVQAQIDTTFSERFRVSFPERSRDDLPDTPTAGTVSDIVSDIVFGTIW